MAVGDGSISNDVGQPADESEQTTSVQHRASDQAMSPQPPRHLGALRSEEAAALEGPLTTAKAAETLGVTRQQLFRLVHEDRSRCIEATNREAMVGVVDAEPWLHMETNGELARMRLRETASEVARLAARARGRREDR